MRGSSGAILRARVRGHLGAKIVVFVVVSARQFRNLVPTVDFVDHRLRVAAPAQFHLCNAFINPAHQRQLIALADIPQDIGNAVEHLGEARRRVRDLLLEIVPEKFCTQAVDRCLTCNRGDERLDLATAQIVVDQDFQAGVELLSLAVKGTLDVVLGNQRFAAATFCGSTRRC